MFTSKVSAVTFNCCTILAVVATRSPKFRVRRELHFNIRIAGQRKFFRRSDNLHNAKTKSVNADAGKRSGSWSKQTIRINHSPSASTHLAVLSAT